MHKELADRFRDLEHRRKALIERVKKLPHDKQTQKPDPKSFSPVEVLMHFAIAEHGNVLQLKKHPPSSLNGAKPKTTFIFRSTVSKLANPERALPTLPTMIPSGPVNVDDAAISWEAAREQLAGFLAQVEDPDAAFIKMGLLLGTASARDFLGLLEAHCTYHEKRFPDLLT